MARKDYAKKRGKTAAASRSQRQTKSAPKKKSFPLIRILFSLLILAGFGYALWQLTSVKPDQNNSATAPKTQPQSARQPSVKPATKPAQTTSGKPATQAKPSSDGIPPVEDQSKRFEFYQMLPNSEVDTANVEPYKSTPKDQQPKHTYVLQVGSFQSAADAEQLRARLILEGLPNVHSRKVTNSNGSIWYQVLTGPFDSRSLLNKAQDRLVRMNIQPLLRRVD